METGERLCPVCDAPAPASLPCSHTSCAACQNEGFAVIMRAAASGEELNKTLSSLLACCECRTPLPEALIPAPVRKLRADCTALGLRKLADPSLAPTCLCGRECRQTPRCPRITPDLLPEYAMRKLAFYCECRGSSPPATLFF
jgi:hypothetical protein